MRASSSRQVPLWLRRVGWLVALWAVSVGALGVVALILRLLMSAAGLTLDK
jgi:hypothetical protein